MVLESCEDSREEQEIPPLVNADEDTAGSHSYTYDCSSLNCRITNPENSFISHNIYNH